MRNFLMAVAALMVLGGCAKVVPLPQWQVGGAPEHPDTGRIVDLRDGSSLTPEQLLAELAGADRVLVGERHDNPDHHRLQAWLIEALSGRRAQGSVLLEMLNPDQQERVSQVQADFAAGRAPDDLEQALAWQKGWEWGLYRPLVEQLLRQPVPVLAANLDRAEIMGIYRQALELSGELSARPAVRDALSAQIRTSHCNMLPESQVPAMLAVQQQRDRRMAERLLSAPRPSVLLAGAFHVRSDLGIPLHLVDLHATGETRVLLLAEAGSAVDAGAADFVWFTPAMPEEDHCAAFAKGKG